MKCSRRDLNPGPKLERLLSLTGLDYGSVVSAVKRPWINAFAGLKFTSHLSGKLSIFLFAHGFGVN